MRSYAAGRPRQRRRSLTPLAAMKQAGEAFDASSGRNAASDRFDAAENAIDTAGAARAGGERSALRPGRRTSGPVATWTGSS